MDSDELEAGEIGSSPDDNNYEIIDMDIDSSSNQEATDDEASQLRQILLEQIQKKRVDERVLRSPTKRKVSKGNKSREGAVNPADETHVTSTPLCWPPKPYLSLGPPPSISPSNFSFIVPPPTPSIFDSFSDPPLTSFDSFMRSNSVAYVDESYNPVASTSKDTPRSPDDLVELTFLVQSSDESSNESEHGEFDIDLAKKENRSVRYEVSRLFKKQQECDARCKDLRREIEKKKKEIDEAEKKLIFHDQKSKEYADRIKRLYDDYFNSDSDRLFKVSREHSQLRTKLLSYRGRSRQKLHALKRRARGLIKMQNDKVIEAVNSRQQDSVNSVPKDRSDLSDGRSSRLSGRLDSSAQVEREIFTRMMERQKQKHQTDSEKRSNLTSQQETRNIQTSNNEVNFPHIVLGGNFPLRSNFGSVEEASTSPLIGIKAYRLFPSFPFEHIEHPAITNRINVEKPLCPFELHGICADPSCEWQHERDIRIPNLDIIKEIIDMCPTAICSPNSNKENLIGKILEINSIDYAARLLASNIPPDTRNELFSKELNGSIVAR